MIATAAGVAALRASERADLDARRWRARDRLLSSTAANDASTPQKILDSREHRAAVASVLSDPALFAAPASHTWLADLALVAAVALGAVLRRVANGGNRRGARGPGDDAARSAAASSDSVLARVRRLESAHDRLALAASRNARDLSKVSTRVRLVRRELSPTLRKVEAESAAREAEAAALDARVRRLGEELRASQRTVGALQGVTAKQFGALAKALTDVKGEVDASKAPTEGSLPSTSGAESFVERDANVTRVRRRRSLTFRVGGEKKSFFSETRASAAAGDDSDPAAGEDEAASEAP